MQRYEVWQNIKSDKHTTLKLDKWSKQCGRHVITAINTKLDQFGTELCLEKDRSNNFISSCKSLPCVTCKHGSHLNHDDLTVL